jgi:hypothetical protein
MDWDGAQARAGALECVGFACGLLARFGLWLNVAATNLRVRAFKARLKTLEHNADT